MKALLAVGALATALLTTAPSFAQTQPVPAIDQAAMAQSRKLMEKIGMVALCRQLLRSNSLQMQNVLMAANPGKADAVARIMPRFMEEFDKRLPEMVDLIAQVYAAHFSATELSEIDAFYDSPVGKKLVEEQPRLIAEFQALGGAFGRRVAIDVLRTLQPELEKNELKVGKT